MNIWEAIRLVSSGVTLVAFIVAVAYAAYRYQAGGTERMLRDAPSESRPRLVEAALRHFHVDTSGLTKEQKFALAMGQIDAHARLQTKRLVAICVVAVLSAAVAAFAVMKSPQPVGSSAGSASSVAAEKADQPSAAGSTNVQGSSTPKAPATATSAALPASAPQPSTSAKAASGNDSAASSVSAAASSAAKSASAPLPKRITSASQVGSSQSKSVPPTQPSRPARKLELAVDIMWDQGEGATPGIQVPKGFACGPWRSLPPLDDKPDYVRKRKDCNASVSASGSGVLSLDASLGQVYVVYRYQLEGQQPRMNYLNWVEKGQKVQRVIAWSLD